MSIFGKWFKSEKDIASKEIVEIPWHLLTSKSQLEEMEKESEAQLVAVFKHSTRCGISRMVLKSFEKGFGFSEENVKLYFLDLLNHRELSQAVASHFDVVHESPQLILLRSGKVVHHTSHHGIDVQDLNSYIEKTP